MNPNFRNTLILICLLAAFLTVIIAVKLTGRPLI
jgi:hypothetical protein